VFLSSAVVDETSALPYVYWNSFSVDIKETNYKHGCSSNDICESTTEKPLCRSCSSTKTPWYNLTTVLSDNNFTVISTTKRVIRVFPPFIRPLRFHVKKAITYIIPPLSLVTNSLSIAIFYRMRHRLQNELALVFVALSVVDTFALTTPFTNLLISISPKLALVRYYIGCQVFRWIEHFSQVCSSYLVLLYTIERFVSVRFPLKRAIMCSGRRIRIAVLCIFVFAPVSQMYTLILYKHFGISCGIRPRSNKIIYSTLKTYIQQVIGIFLPYCCVAILNTMIIYHLAKYRKQRAALQASSTNSEEKANRSMTVMLFTASTYSLIIMLPMFVERLMDPAGRNMSSVFSLWAISIIAPWNYCGNFFFYVIGGKMFRKELCNMFFCRQSNGKFIQRSYANKKPYSLTNPRDAKACPKLCSGVTMGWLMRLMMGAPLAMGPPAVQEFLMINFYSSRATFLT